MKITDVSEYTYYRIETDEGIDYRRDGDSPNWERLHGDSWETMYSEEEKLERMFQEYLFGK